MKDALLLATELRALGLKVDLFPGVVKLAQQYEVAEKKGILFAVLLDREELSRGNLVIRSLKERSEMVRSYC